MSLVECLQYTIKLLYEDLTCFNTLVHFICTLLATCVDYDPLVPPGLTNIVAIAAAGAFASTRSLALHSNGTVSAWGSDLNPLLAGRRCERI